MKILILNIILFFAFGTLLGQTEIKVKIDTLKVIQPKNIEGELIEYYYGDFKDPIYFSKKDVINEFVLLANEIKKENDFKADSTKDVSLVYPRIRSCIKYLTKASNLTFKKNKKTGYPENLSIHDLSDRYLGEIACDLFDKGKFKFSENSMYYGKKIYKAIVNESLSNSSTESTKYYVDKKSICTCPPIIHSDYFDF